MRHPSYLSSRDETSFPCRNSLTNRMNGRRTPPTTRPSCVGLFSTPFSPLHLNRSISAESGHYRPGPWPRISSSNDYHAMRCIERTSINHSKVQNVRLKQPSRLSMNGQTVLAMLHPTDAASSRQDDNVSTPTPLRGESPKERRKSEYAVAKNDVGGESLIYSFPPKKLGKPPGEKMVDNAKERSIKSSAAPNQPSPLRQEVSADNRNGAKTPNNARFPHPQNAKGNDVDRYDQIVTKVSQPRDTSKYGLSDAADASEIPSKTASDKILADGTSPTSDQSSIDGWSRKTPSSSSSPSKKKKNKKKKKVSLLQFSSLTVNSLSTSL
jgi:hypothetical protein